MKNTLLRTLAPGLLLFGLAVSIQAAPQRDWHQERETFYHGEGWRMHLFDRVRDDLTHVQEATFRGGDEYRIARTKEELNELQGKLAAHQYDEAKLDEVIGALQRVVADNRLTPNDRDVLNDDLSRLRDYRAHHENWFH